MFVPFLSRRGEPTGEAETGVWSWLERRKGGGGGGRSSASKSSGSRSSSSSKSKTTFSGSGGSRSTSYSPSSSSKKNQSNVHKKTKQKVWKPYTSSGSTGWVKQVGVASTIPAGYFFAGRVAGGGTREAIYGTKTYGSGYPGVTGRGTSGRGFPFFFWPLSWPLAVGGGAGAALYLHSNYEYGAPSNTSRPGGPMSYSIITSSTETPSTFRFLADNATLTILNLEIEAACGELVERSRSYTSTVLGETETSPAPEQVVQYYRASSAALTLDGYTNEATYAVEGTADSPLPENADQELLTCLNETIGNTIPLIDNGTSVVQVGSSLNIVGLAGLVWILLWAS